MAYSNIELRMQFASRSSAIPNPSVNFHYFAASTAADVTDVQDLVNFVIASFNTIPSGAVGSPSSYLHGVLSRTANSARWEAYDVTAHLDGSRAGSPILIGSWATTVATSGGGTNPEGTAVVITLQAPYGTDVEFGPGTRPRARDRGRIYFGPVSSAGFQADANGHVGVSTQMRTDLCQWIKAINVHTTAPHSIPYNLCVWSRKNAIMKSLQEVWVDDRVDYRRQRAGVETTKTIVGLP